MKIVGSLVCGPGEADRWLEETLKEFARLCDDVVVCFSNAGPREKALVAKYDFRSYEDNREWGLHQPRIKSKLLQTILLLEPDWILALDADETVPSVTRKTLEGLTEGREACHFYVVDLWNDTEHYSKTLSFWNVRFYKADASKGVAFLNKPVHCGIAPPYFYSRPARETYVPHILLHKGLMRREDRLRKAERYQVYDPRAQHKGQEYYEALLADDWTGSMYNQNEVLTKLQSYVAKLR